MLDSALSASSKISQQQGSAGLAAAGSKSRGSKRRQPNADEDRQLPKPKRVRSAACAATVVMPPGILKAPSMQMGASGVEQLTQPKRVRFAVPIDDRNQSDGGSHGAHDASGQNCSSPVGLDGADELMPQRVRNAPVHRPVQQRGRQRKGIPRRGAL